MKRKVVIRLKGINLFFHSIKQGLANLRKNRMFTLASMGTIAALAPIAVGISEKTGFALSICIGAVVCGAMFGDNLSMISDTTIAAVKTQGCEMKDKFKANLFFRQRLLQY